MKKPLPDMTQAYRLKAPVRTATFKYRINQYLWVKRHDGWVRGKVESKWDFEGQPFYRLTVNDEAGALRFLVSGHERLFSKEPT